MRKHVLMPLLVCSSALSMSRTSLAQDELAKRLIPLASVMRSGNSKYRSIEVRSQSRGFNKPHLPDSVIVCHVMYCAPDSYSMCVFDGNTGTPVVYSTDQGFVFYDAIGNRIWYSRGSRVFWSLKQHNEDFELIWEFGRLHDPSSQISLDIPSLLRNREDDVVAEAIGPQKYRLGCVSSAGTSLAMFVDMSKAYPLTRIEYYGLESKVKPRVTVDRIIVNNDIDGKNFRFPDRKTLGDNFRVLDGALDEASWEATWFPLFRRGVMARLLVNDPKLRFEDAFSEVKDIDVEAFKKNDRETTNKLKRIFDWPLIGLERK